MQFSTPWIRAVRIFIKTVPLRAVSGVVIAFCLSACNSVPGLKEDPTLLGSSTTLAPPDAPKCQSCHTYPLHDVNHNYHLMSANVNRNNLGFPQLNNITTCMDCHFNSIRHFKFTHSDTTWKDAAGNPISQHTLPTDIIDSIRNFVGYRPLGYFAADTTRGRFLAEDIDSLIFRTARLGEMVQWRTGFAHDNGVVDVSFPPNDVKSQDSLNTAYKPKDLSCSAMTCHNNPDALYRWMSPSQGISHCPSLTGQDPTCNEIPTPASNP